MRRFNKITIVGVGLIGGSIGLALRKRKLAGTVCGVFRRRVSLRKALKKKAVTEATLELSEGVRGADMVIFACDVGRIPMLVKKASKFAKDGCVFTDVGSVKESIVKSVRGKAGRADFVGAHPMAGSEKSGVEHADAGLFGGSNTILTPASGTSKKALVAVKSLWKALGSNVIVLTPTEHDRLISQISHLPHIVAFSLCDVPEKKAFRFASTGFKDATRIASADPNLWAQIAVSNGKNLRKDIKRVVKALNKFGSLLSKKDARRLCAGFKKSKKKRDSLKG
jgi:prephenate dehydrogenase